MTRDELIDAIIEERKRIFPKDATGDFEEYALLFDNYGVTEEEDVKWIFLIGYHIDKEPLTELMGYAPYTEGEIPNAEEIQETEEWKQFLEDDHTMGVFLKELLQKYRSNQAVYNP